MPTLEKYLTLFEPIFERMQTDEEVSEVRRQLNDLVKFESLYSEEQKE